MADFNEKPKMADAAGGKALVVEGQVYEVRYLPAKPRAGRMDVRRRGGLAFGRERQMVSTAEYDGVQTVEAAELEKILGDSRLSHRKVEAPAPKAGPELVGVEALQGTGGRAAKATRKGKAKG